MELLLKDSHEEKRCNGNADLCFHCIEGVAPEDLDFEVLFHPFEEEFNLSAMSVEIGDGECGYIEIVRKVDVVFVGFFVVVFYAA